MEICGCSPGLVNFSAFESKLESTCCNVSAWPSTSGNWAGTSTLMSLDLSCFDRKVSAMTAGILIGSGYMSVRERRLYSSRLWIRELMRDPASMIICR